MQRLTVWVALVLSMSSLPPTRCLAETRAGPMRLAAMDMPMDMSGMDMEGDGDSGAKLAQSLCAPCHGSQGISTSETYPSLAGQNEMYLATALQAYRSGARKAPPMNTVAAKLSDQDIGNLAAYFARLNSGQKHRSACPLSGG